MKTPTFSSGDVTRASGMGVALDCPAGCKMCAASDHAAYIAREDRDQAKANMITARQDRDIALALMREAQRDSVKWRQYFLLSLAVLLAIFVMVVAGWIR
jgi:predicted anti-sigma-YlaC factor YlaD